MQTENLTKLKINKLTQAQYNAALSADTIQGNELYMVTDSVLDVSKGGTGATTVAGARNALGLGNTSGALPIANGGTGATTSTAAMTNLGVADYIIERGTSGIWRYEKWNSGKAVCYTLSVVTYNGLSMSASGYSYVSGVVSQSLPSGLFVNANYTCSAQEQTDGRLAKVVRQSSSTASTFKFKVHSSASGTTTANIRFDIKGRWK